MSVAVGLGFGHGVHAEVVAAQVDGLDAVVGHGLLLVGVGLALQYLIGGIHHVLVLGLVYLAPDAAPAQSAVEFRAPAVCVGEAALVGGVHKLPGGLARAHGGVSPCRGDGLHAGHGDEHAAEDVGLRALVEQAALAREHGVVAHEQGVERYGGLLLEHLAHVAGDAHTPEPVGGEARGVALAEVDEEVGDAAKSALL